MGNIKVIRTFRNMLNIFGISRLYNCFEFNFSLIVTIVLYTSMFFIYREDFRILLLDSSKLFIGVDTAILAVVITGLAILLSVTDSSFLKFLSARNLYIRLFFPFYLSSVFWGSHILLSLVLLLISHTYLEGIILNGVLLAYFFIYLFLFIYSLLNSISLVGTIIKLGDRKIEFITIMEQKTSTPSHNTTLPQGRE